MSHHRDNYHRHGHSSSSSSSRRHGDSRYNSGGSGRGGAGNSYSSYDNSSYGGYSGGGGQFRDKKRSVKAFHICSDIDTFPFIRFSDYRSLDEYVPRKTRWDTSRLPPLQKNFFREHPITKDRSEVTHHSLTLSILLPPSLPPSIIPFITHSLPLPPSFNHSLFNIFCFPPQEDVMGFFKKNNMFVRGRDVPKPWLTFQEASFPGQQFHSIETASVWSRTAHLGQLLYFDFKTYFCQHVHV